jgi:multiple sugar transport system permease protein
MRIKNPILRRNLIAYGFLGIPMLIFTIFVLFPLALAVIFSFIDFVPSYPVFQMKWGGLKNFAAIYRDMQQENSIFNHALLNTCIWSLVVVPVGGIVVPLILALLVKPCGTFNRIIFRSIFYLPGVISGVIMAVVWKWIYNPRPTGLFNAVLGFFGFEAYDWLGHTGSALPSLMFMAVAGGGGAGMIMYLAGMDSIPNDLYDAARIDGANRWTTFKNVTWPLLKPITLFLMVMSTIASFQVFTQIYIMTKGGPSNSTVTLVYLIYNHAFKTSKLGLASAEAMVLFLIIVVISVIEFKLFSSDVEY